MGRPRKYASDAERAAAHRERWAIKSFRTEKETADTIAKLAAHVDEPESEVINSLIKFALLNRNWFTLGLFGKRMPTVGTHMTYSQKRGNRAAPADDNEDSE